MSTQARKANTGLDLTGKTAVIAGGSQGIGAGVAVRFAQAGANVVIVGRSEKRLKEVVEKARSVAPSKSQFISYISADLSLVASLKDVANKVDLETSGKVDYLVQTQGGTPNGLYDLTSEGIETHFATQVLGRFVLNYLLSKSGALKGTSINIAAPGGSQTEFDLNDIELQSKKDSMRLAQMAAAGARDGLIIDTYTKALQSRYPENRYVHVFPGFVQTDVMKNQNLPFVLRLIIEWVLYPIAARTFGNTPESYADIPVFLAANGQADALLAREGYFLSEANKKAALAPWALKGENQDAVFEKLMSYIN